MTHDRPMYFVREGTTDPITLELYSVDPETKQLTGIGIAGRQDVEWVMKPRNGDATVTFKESDASSQVSVPQESAPAQVKFSPLVTDLEAASKGYDLYVVVVDGGGVRTDFPNEKNALIEVLEA